MTAVLVDTSVLVYAYDRGEHAKQKQAIQVLERLHATGIGQLSVQCLAEFFSAIIRGPRPRLTVAEAKQQLEYLTRAWPVMDLTPMIALEAARGVR